jgi:Leucine-rich repeat (LRR) protein
MRPSRPAKPPTRPFSLRELLHTARNPSYRAPRAADVLTPQPAELGGRGLEAFGAKDLVVRDGVVVGMSLSGRAFISLGETLFRLMPLREVRLVAVQPFVGELARCPHLGRLHRLDLTGNHIGERGLRELLASPFVGELREIGLSGNDLAALPALPANLIALELADNRLGTVPALPQLQSLDVSRNPLRSFDFPAGLERLTASGCGLPVESLRPLTALAELDASFNALGPAGADAIAELPVRLRRLDLSFNDIESGGAEALAFAESLSSLVSLNLSANRIDAAGAVALADSPHFGTVEELTLATNPIGDCGAVALLRGEAFGSLQRLDISNCRLTDDGVAGLCATGALGGLRALSLAWNPCGDAAAHALARCPDLAGLRELDLTGTRLGFAGAIALAESPHLVNLRLLTLGENTRLPADAVGMLRERYNLGERPV